MRKNAEKKIVRQEDSSQVGAGMKVFQAMLEQDRVALCGPSSKAGGQELQQTLALIETLTMKAQKVADGGSGLSSEFEQLQRFARDEVHNADHHYQTARSTFAGEGSHSRRCDHASELRKSMFHVGSALYNNDARVRLAAQVRIPLIVKKGSGEISRSINTARRLRPCRDRRRACHPNS